MVLTAPFGDLHRIVGREREQSRLGELLRNSLNGVGSLVLVSGEAGIGKTTLVRGLIQQAEEQGALVLSGGCYDLTTTPLYGPWIDAIREFQPTLGQPPVPAWFGDPDQLEKAASQAALFEQVRQFLTGIAGHQPLVIVLEDLHWSDPASLDLLRFVARASSNHPLVLAITYRDDELTRQGALYQMLPALIRETPASRIDLRRLSPDAVSDLIATRYALAGADHARLLDHVQRLAEGNPLFVGELLRSLEDEGVLRYPADDNSNAWMLGDLHRMHLPSLVLQVIDRRLAHLSNETRDALETAAVIGQRVPVDLWHMTSGLNTDRLDDAIDQALAARVFQETADATGLMFTHALVREALYNGIILTRRRARHLVIAETLAAMPRPEPDAVAYHFQQAGDERALEWLVRAGLRAWHSSAWIMAASRFEAAAAMLEDDPSRARECGWLFYMAATLQRYTDNQRTLALLDQAERMAALSGDEVLAADARWHRGLTRCQLGDIRLGLLEMELGNDALDRLAREQFVLAEEDLAEHVIRSLLLEEDSEHIEDAAPARARRFSPALLQRGELGNQLCLAGRYCEVLEMGQEWVSLVEELFGHEYLRNTGSMGGHIGLGRAYAMLGRPADAPEQMYLARVASREVGDYFAVSWCILNELQFVTIPYFADDPRMRWRLIGEAERDAEHLEHLMAGTSHNMLCKMAVDFIEARWEEFDRPEFDEERIDHHPMYWYVRIVQGRLARHRGGLDAAWEQVGELLPEGPATDPGDCYFLYANEGQRLAIDLSLDAGDFESARAWLEAHDRWLAWSGAVLGQAEGQMLWARYMQLTGSPGQARQHAVRALERASDPRQPLALLSAHRLLGEIETSRGMYVDAERHLGESLILANACVAPYEQAMTQLALAELSLAAGKQEAVGPLLDQVREICISLDARPTLSRIEDLASRLETHVSPPPTLPAGLTAREGEVLRLIAEGHSNREIAEALFLSPRTVERHIANIYLKIDVHSRDEAIEFVRRLHLA